MQTLAKNGLFGTQLLKITYNIHVYQEKMLVFNLRCVYNIKEARFLVANILLIKALGKYLEAKGCAAG